MQQDAPYEMKQRRDTFAHNAWYKLSVRRGSRVLLSLEQRSLRGISASWLSPGISSSRDVVGVLSVFLLHPKWIAKHTTINVSKSGAKTANDANDSPPLPIEIIRSGNEYKSCTLDLKTSFDCAQRKMVRVINRKFDSKRAPALPSLDKNASCAPQSSVVSPPLDESTISYASKMNERVAVDEYVVCVCGWQPGMRCDYWLSASTLSDDESFDGIVSFERSEIEKPFPSLIERQIMCAPCGSSNREMQLMEANDAYFWNATEKSCVDVLDAAVRATVTRLLSFSLHTCACGAALFLIKNTALPAMRGKRPSVEDRVGVVAAAIGGLSLLSLLCVE